MVLETLDGSEGTTDLQGGERPTPPEVPLGSTPQAAADEGAAGQEASEPEMAGASPPQSQAPASSMSEEMLDAYGYDRPKRGDIRAGTVVSIQAADLVIDIGAKRECVIPASDWQKMASETGAQFQVGDEVSVYIVRAEDREGHLVGSLHMAQMEGDWVRAEQFEASGEIFEAKVSGQNRGGLLVPFGRLRGFVPASHLVGTGTDSENRPAVLGQWVGKTLPFKVIEVNRRRNRLILSYRAARRQWRTQQKRTLLEELHEGDVRRGTVSSVATFGAFVDLGGADGLIHVSEIAWYRVEHPGEVLQVGQEVEVYVLRVDSDSGRIGLSLKRLQPDPWTLVAEKYTPGQTVEGTITKLVDFGAFAQIERGIEGLIHITELADPAPSRPEEVVQPGQVYLLRVLRIDAANRRVGLSLKAVGSLEVEAWQARRAGEQEAPGPGEEPAGPPDPGDAAIGDDGIEG